MGKKWQGTKVLTLPQKMENGKMGNGKTPIYANMKGGTQKQHVPQLLRGCSVPHSRPYPLSRVLDKLSHAGLQGTLSSPPHIYDASELSETRPRQSPLSVEPKRVANL
jgi:hypothetical protein